MWKINVIGWLFYFVSQMVLGQTRQSTSLDRALLATTFAKVDSLLSLDQGNFWGHSLKGPILVVSPTTRVFIANQQNKRQSFQPLSPLFSDTLPEALPVANTALNWEGKRWTMVLWPLPEEPTARNHLIIHELFHYIQPAIGFDSLREANNSHLDTYDGRVLLRLELQALQAALSTEHNTEQREHLAQALLFRQQRHQSTAIKEAEDRLELNEGLAEYTAAMLSGRKPEALKKHFIQQIDQFYKMSTFVRSFAYYTVPVYGYLLALQKPNWHQSVTRNTSLTDLFSDAFALSTASPATTIASVTKQYGYPYDTIVQEETKREEKRLTKIAKYKKTFIEDNTLKLPF
ncbi:MAG: hypothetical protein AAF734_12390, partial [Bacteroidota bacterium]